MKLLKWILIIRGKKNKKERTSETKASTSDFINTCDLVLSGAEREACAERESCLLLGLCIGSKERHYYFTYSQSIDPTERHVSTDWWFSVHKIIPKWGMILKRGTTIHF